MILKKTAAAFAMLLIGSSVYAGEYYNADLQIELNENGSGRAMGNLQAVRSSEDTVANIGCGFRVSAPSPLQDEISADDVFNYAFCRANNEEGVSIFCFTELPALIEPLKAMSAKSWIMFEFDEDGNCTKIGASNQSIYLE